MTIGVLPIAGRLLTDSFNLHCYCSFSSYQVLNVGDIIDITHCVTHCGSSRDDKVICNIHVFLPPVVTGNYISHKFVSKKSKISILSHHITCFAGRSFVIMYVVGPPNRLVLFRLG